MRTLRRIARSMSTRPALGRRDSAQERQADQFADTVVAGGFVAPGTARSPGHDGAASAVPQAAFGVMREAGQRLDGPTRDFMERRFGHDFGAVRVHADGAAADSARTLGAQAWTAGNHLVFGAGAYAPASSQGRHLIAHELAHVVQSSQAPAGVAPSLMRKAAPEKFYQRVLDLLEVDRQDMVRQATPPGRQAVIPPMRHAGLKALLALCEAIDQSRVKDVPALLQAFFDADSVSENHLDKPFFYDLQARLVRLGLGAESEKLRQYHGEHVRFSATHDPGAGARRLDFVTALIAMSEADLTADLPDKGSPAQLRDALRVIVRAYAPLRDAISEIDLDRVDEQRRQPVAAGRGKPYELGLYEAYEALLARFFVAFQTGFQALMDRAIKGFESGQGEEPLKLARDVLQQDLRGELEPDDRAKRLAWMRLPVTRTSAIKAGKGTSEDRFAKGNEARARRVQVNSYDSADGSVAEVQMSLAAMFRAREAQIAALARIYGVTGLLPRGDTPDQDAEIAQEARENAAAIARLKGSRLRLESDDDWRAFVLEKYRGMVNPPKDGPRLLKSTPQAALDSVISLLYLYLQAFTLHAQVTHIYDVGGVADNYVNRKFPRALSGQALQDCGTYAVRVAYILSLVRKELGLRFRLVMMPAHVALVIDGEGLATYVAHNDHFKRISPAALSALRKSWDDDTAPTSARAPKDDTQFIGEVAASTYIPGAHATPFRVADVDKPGASRPAHAAALWSQYQREARKDVFGPSSRDKNSRHHQFHRRYLGLSTAPQRIHNETILPYWNVRGPEAWDAFTEALRQKAKADAISGEDLTPILVAYADAIRTAQEPIWRGYETLDRERAAISKSFDEDADLLDSKDKDARLSNPARTGALNPEPRPLHLQAYRDQVQEYSIEVAATINGKFSATAVRARLYPPFLPRSVKAMSRID